MNTSLKQLAIKNIDAAMTRFLCLGEPAMKYARAIKAELGTCQVMSLPEILDEIKRETELGEKYVLAMAVDPCKSEAENRRILKDFLPRR